MRTLQKQKNTVPRLLYGMLIATFFSCSDFLEEKPDNRTLINDIEEMELAVENLVPRAEYIFTEFMTNDYAFKDIPSHVVESAKDLITLLYTFRVTKESLPNSAFPISDLNPNMAWLRYYYRIQNTSLIIDRVNNYNAKNDVEAQLKQHILGKALAIRAYCHFMLVNLFAKSYDAATAASDVGIPLVTKYTGAAIEKYPIASVQETYDFIEKELLQALPMIRTWKEEPNPKFNFTKISVEALLCQFYLFKKDWENTVKYADKVIAKNSNILDVAFIYTTFNETKEKSKQFFNPDNPSYLLISENTYQLLSYFWSGFYPYPLQGFLISQGKEENRDHFIVTSNLSGDIVPIKVEYFLGGGPPRHTGLFPLLSIDRVWYNKAEANIELGNLDEAKQDIQLLLSKDNYPNTFWTDKLEGISDKDALMAYLLDSKRMRFYSEGVRWFDMKRHGIPVTHEMNGNEFIIDGTKPEQYVIKYPLEEIDNQ